MFEAADGSDSIWERLFTAYLPRKRSTAIWQLEGADLHTALHEPWRSCRFLCSTDLLSQVLILIICMTSVDSSPSLVLAGDFRPTVSELQPPYLSCSWPLP